MAQAPHTREVHVLSPALNKSFPSNYISTTKYNIFTFLPIALFYQFIKFANIYFLLTAVLQSLPSISPLNPASAIAPLCFVVFVSLIREGIEDFMRWRSDRKTNSEATEVWKDGVFTPCTFKDVRVGDLVKITNNHKFPSDLILLSTPLENGKAYIETGSLDGEKNLKVKESFQETYQKVRDVGAIRLHGWMSLGPPDPNLSYLDGRFNYKGKWFPLSGKNMLLAGASLRNTPWAIGVVAYTGNDTKVRQSALLNRYKQSTLDKQVNKCVFFIVFLELFLCMVPAVGLSWFEENRRRQHLYLWDTNKTPTWLGFLNFWTYFLLLNAMLPISLIVTMEMVKVGQAYFMSHDSEMYSHIRDKFCGVSSSSLNEELGMIQHIFTDKTGTLTCNKMEFKTCVIGETRYGDQKDIMTHGTRADSMNTSRVHVRTFKSPHLNNDLFFPIGRQHAVAPYEITSSSGVEETLRCQQDLTRHWMRCVALCHECLAENVGDDSEKIEYQSQSPDEITLVDIARAFGYVYRGTYGGVIHLEVHEPGQEPKLLKFERLQLIEFNSDRKRNSVIIRDPENGKIYHYMKGADNKMKERLGPRQPFQAKVYSEIGFFSNEGLRTLVQSFKIIPQREYDEWAARYREAEVAENKDVVMAQLAEEIEKNMYLLGCTGVEDSLQENVPQTIEALIEANIKVWMLTGDKLETAENIGLTCRLIRRDMLILKLPSGDLKNCLGLMEQHLKELPAKDDLSTPEIGMIIEDTVFRFLLYRPLEDPGDYSDAQKADISRVQEIFFKITGRQRCKTVICCRVSPGQKRSIVRLMKERTNCVSLAVGDGANDVAMIKEAHIGIGIYGEEGVQAVQAADYSLGEFQYLWELLLKHGRWNYIRLSEMILYFFYKNLVFTMPQWFFTFYCIYSGQTVYDDWYLTLYNMLFTAFPLMVRALFEYDIAPPKRVSAHSNIWTDPVTSEIAIEPNHESLRNPLIRRLFPRAYITSQTGSIFTFWWFLFWIANGIFHSIIIFFIPLCVYGESDILKHNGLSADFWCVSITSFCCIVFVVNLKFVFVCRLWNVFHIVTVLFISIAVYWAFIWVYDAITFANNRHTLEMLMGTAPFWLCILVCSGLSIVTDATAHWLWRMLIRSPGDALRDYERGTLMPAADKPKEEEQE